jgi:hypothetical protein
MRRLLIKNSYFILRIQSIERHKSLFEIEFEIAMEAVKGALRVLARANREGATDGKSACELRDGTGCAQEITQRFSHVLEERRSSLLSSCCVCVPFWMG